MVSILPATATVIGVVVLAQVPTPAEVVGVALVVAGVGLHREAPADAREISRGEACRGAARRAALAACCRAGTA